MNDRNPFTSQPDLRNIVTFVTQISVRIYVDEVQVDPNVLFPYLIIACKSSDNMEAMFQFKLCNHPEALFESIDRLRVSKKPVFEDAIYSNLFPDMPIPI